MMARGVKGTGPYGKKAKEKRRRAGHKDWSKQLQDEGAALRARAEKVNVEPDRAAEALHDQVDELAKENARQGVANRMANEAFGVEPRAVPSSHYGDNARYFKVEPLRSGPGIFALPHWGLNGIGRMESTVRLVSEAGGGLTMRAAEAEVIGAYLSKWASEERQREGYLGLAR